MRQAFLRTDSDNGLGVGVERYVESPSTTPGVTDQTTWYVFDGWRAIEERAIINTDQEIVRARYGFGLGLDEVLWMDRDVAMSGQDPDPNGLTDDVVDSRMFIHHDLRGSAVAVTNDPTDPANTTVLERFTYSAYGAVTAWWDADWGVDESYSNSGVIWLD